MNSFYGIPKQLFLLLYIKKYKRSGKSSKVIRAISVRISCGKIMKIVFGWTLKNAKVSPKLILRKDSRYFWSFINRKNKKSLLNHNKYHNNFERNSVKISDRFSVFTTSILNNSSILNTVIINGI